MLTWKCRERRSMTIMVRNDHNGQELGIENKKSDCYPFNNSIAGN